MNEISLWTGDSNPSGEYETKGFGAYQTFGNLLISSSSSTKSKVSSPSGQKPFYENEGVASASDGNPDTKWAVEHGGRPVVWQTELEIPRVLTSYSLTSANDVPARDPQSWELAGSLNGTDWTTLDRRSNEPLARALPGPPKP